MLPDPGPLQPGPLDEHPGLAQLSQSPLGGLVAQREPVDQIRYRAFTTGWATRHGKARHPAA